MLERHAREMWSSLGRAIGAAGDADFQAAVRAFLAGHVAFDNYLLIAYVGAEPPVILSRASASPLVHAGIESDYARAHYLLDPFYIAHLAAVPAGVHRLTDLAPDKFRGTAYFERYYERTTLLDELAFFAYPANGWTLNICIGRDETSGLSFSKADLCRARAIAPVVTALLETRYASASLHEQRAKSDPVADLRRRLRSREGIEITPRQAEVAMLILRGHSAKSISDVLGISWQTVRVFRRQLYERCRVTSQAELFAKVMPLL
ncbi:LuxR C-terminal-related transcriptional regulator [Rubellimicrobium aerolatum]|uniref:LuxR C-terminal-related transcriptional regulator n=1 Tax=Rubellimicrobium aerolatum TaxID=490979 RepID=A0ABW0SHL8_9RHOB|nr:LuxR C-terminal-related transcriptional regulator [Rubellimicrobium aerolatum]MBP1807442.1 DNA-binding CsgD family transcriptional regulator [Rubellimicrobium aerolatum]